MWCSLVDAICVILSAIKLCDKNLKVLLSFDCLSRFKSLSWNEWVGDVIVNCKIEECNTKSIHQWNKNLNLRELLNTPPFFIKYTTHRTPHHTYLAPSPVIILLPPSQHLYLRTYGLDAADWSCRLVKLWESGPSLSPYPFPSHSSLPPLLGRASQSSSPSPGGVRCGVWSI